MKKIALSLAVLTSLALAEDSPLTTHTELSYVNTDGNTVTESFALDFMGKKAWGDHSLQFDLDALYGSEDNVENNNKYIAELNYDYRFADNFTVNYIANYKSDKFSGYDYQWFTGPGAKYIALEGKVHNLFLQANILVNEDATMDKFYTADPASGGVETPYPYSPVKGPFKVDGDSRSYGGYIAKVDYSWQITESFKFIQLADYRSDFDNADNYFINSKTALESKISDIFSMGLSYKVSYANLPPEGNERTDKTFLASLIIDY